MKKKILSAVLIVACISCAACLGACGNTDDKSNGTSNQPAAQATAATESIATAEAPVAGESAEASAAAEKITSGEVFVGEDEAVSVELTDGWYVDEQEDHEITLRSEDLGSFPEIDVKYQTIYTKGEGAEAWAKNINENYGGGHKITRQTINGIKYWVLDATDDGEQTHFFADIDSEHYLEVSCMFFNVKKADKILKNISIVK